MACRVEHLDAVTVSVSVGPAQLPALGAALERYQCATVGELAEVLILQAVNVERRRAEIREGAARVVCTWSYFSWAPGRWRAPGCSHLRRWSP